MKNLGVMEIFYGTLWLDSERIAYAEFLRELGMGFYIYGPKGDDCLRKNWRNRPSPEEMKRYQGFREAFQKNQIQFGMILSPHGLDQGFSLEDRRALGEKVKVLSDLGLDYFGLFFDDMKSAENLAERQIEVAMEVAAVTPAKIIFCPSFYSFDPMLDALFGDRPAQYLETIGRDLPQKMEVLWTGEQIISPEISRAHLTEVTQLLGRRPFVCDNFYADDGPLNCNFLRLLAPTGRSSGAFQQASQWAFNPMNQAHLSKLALRSIANLVTGLEPHPAFLHALQSSLAAPLVDFLTTKAGLFTEMGLEAIEAGERGRLRAQLLASFPFDPVAREVARWLAGDYAIELSTLVDQSCYFG